MKKLPNYPVVMVTWYDAFTVLGWTAPDHLMDKVKGNKCRTLGLLVKETKRGLWVSTTLNRGGYAVDCLFNPPGGDYQALPRDEARM